MRKKRLYLISSIFVMSAIGVHIFLRSIYVVPILMYHNIDENYKQSKLSVSPKSFEKQMKFLKDNNYNIVSLQELVRMIRSKRPMPRKTVAITFDDGYKNNYTHAFWALKKYNIPATVFVAVNKIGTDGHLSWGDLKKMSENNISIGSHTLSECFLPDIKDDTELKKEIYESRNRIKTRIPDGGDFIAYCSGGFNDKIRDMVIAAGYKGACATNPGRRYPKNDIFALKRLRISRTSDNLFVFWIQTSGFYTWIKEIRDEE